MTSEQRTGFMVTICSALLTGRKEASKRAQEDQYTKAVSDAETILERIESSVWANIADERFWVDKRFDVVREELRKPNLSPLAVSSLHSEAVHLMKARRRARV